MKLQATLKSCLDTSVNFIFDNNIEARFVQRTEDYFIIYVSSHDGCNKACRFCHLTQTKQTSFNEVTLDQYKAQIVTVLDYYKEQLLKGKAKANHVNINFMSRGEPLANNQLLDNFSELVQWVQSEVSPLELTFTFNVSSIIPAGTNLNKVAKALMNNKENVALYYSLYSLDAVFRKKWIPKAENPLVSLRWLKSLQDEFGLKVVLHWAFIEGENDSESDVQDIVNLVSELNLSAKFNLVRYNPYSENQGQETNERTIEELFNIVLLGMKEPGSRIVPKVGFDVKASCGMFIA